MTSRYWMFTINNPELTNEQLVARFTQSRQFRFVVFQLERGDEGTLHFQGTPIFQENRSLLVPIFPPNSTLLGYLGLLNERALVFIRRNYSDTAHWERRRGSHRQALTYVTKEDTRVDGPWEAGDVPVDAGQGTRTDISTAITALQEGGLRAAVDQAPEVIVRYPSGIKLYYSLLPPPAPAPKEIVLHYGPSGSGKTRYVYDNHDAGEIYKKAPHSKWFDGYLDHPILVMDEFTGWVTLDYLLSLIDRYPHQCETKGGTVWLRSNIIYFTTTTHPALWFDWFRRSHRYVELVRRFSVVRIFSMVNPPRELSGEELEEFWSVSTHGPLVNRWI